MSYVTTVDSDETVQIENDLMGYVIIIDSDQSAYKQSLIRVYSGCYI